MKNYSYLIGQRIGDVTVLEILRHGIQFGRCKIHCHKCGKEAEVTLEGIVYGKTSSCGCGKYIKIKGPQNKLFEDLAGERFGFLTVERYDDNSSERVRWICRCQCGKQKSVIAKHLVGGETTSCGCKQHEYGENSKSWKGYKDISGKYWACLQKNARLRGLPFIISLEDVWKQYLVQDRRCAYTNQTILFRGHKQRGTASVDRIDSSKGYTVDNIQIIHIDINRMKSDFSEKYFLLMCKNVIDFSYARLS